VNWLHHAALAGAAFGLGASVGSFLNVCIWRLPRGESVIRPASRCPRCGSPIAARDNVPVVSWLLLRGRCRCCARAISARYPLVEAAVGLLFAAVVLFETASGPLDVFDRGPLTVLALVGYHWALLALLVTAAMIEHDRRRAPRLLLTVGPCALPASFLSSTTASLVAIALLACAVGDLVGVGLNLGLLAVFLRGGGAR
jgi:leader peptidase (prepilin peptidase) / N-methyltransferase